MCDSLTMIAIPYTWLLIIGQPSAFRCLMASKGCKRLSQGLADGHRDREVNNGEQDIQQILTVRMLLAH